MCMIRVSYPPPLYTTVQVSCVILFYHCRQKMTYTVNTLLMFLMHYHNGLKGARWKYRTSLPPQLYSFPQVPHNLSRIVSLKAIIDINETFPLFSAHWNNGWQWLLRRHSVWESAEFHIPKANWDSTKKRMHSNTMPYWQWFSTSVPW